MAFTSLSQNIDIHFLLEAYRRTRKDGAVGIDGQTAAQYEENLMANLGSLLDRLKSGSYLAPPVKRVYIPKGDGKLRPLGIPTFEDKVLQRAVAMILEAIYEQDFKKCSYGFRPNLSAHQALEALREAAMTRRTRMVVEVDIKSFFDSLDHGHLRSFLDRRIRDGVLRRMIDKWLCAGIMEEGRHERSESGTPQGGVISPILANIYLHEVLDTWFDDEIKPTLKGRSELVRYADDFVIVLSVAEDAKRLMSLLSERFEKYGLSLHPEKTRLVPFDRPIGRQGKPGSFDFLGFTHYWGKSRNGYWVVKKKTASSRLKRSLKRIADWCRRKRHENLVVQWGVLSAKLRGHYNYYGVTGNFRLLNRFYEEVKSTWRKWLSRRSQRGYLSWEKMKEILGNLLLPSPKIVHSSYGKP